jgi:alpha-L-fucosidase
MTHFEPTWDSLRNYQVPDWFKNAKFGIFIHWGLYSVPAFDNEWYSRNMYQIGNPTYEHHRQTWGDQSRFGYKDFIPLFTARQFDPDAWAALFKQSGARYVVPVAEHHDGFAMYDSKLTPWNAAQMGPRRDIIGELAAAVREQDMVFGMSYHRAEHWWFFDGGLKFDSDVRNPANASFYGPPFPAPQTTDFGSNEWKSRDWQPRPDAKFLDDWLARCYELVDRYQPQVIYFDWWIEQIIFQPYLQKFAAYYYNRAAEWDKGVVLTNKFGAFPEGTAMYDLERGKLNHLREDYWQTDASVSYKSWCYVEDDDLKTTTTLVHDLVDAVSKNANLLLNVGPKADGTFSQEVVALLQGIGQWLEVNGEAIYDTRHWHTFGEGITTQPEGHLREREHTPYTARDVRYTQRDGALYAICLGWPGKSIVFQTLGANSPLRAGMIGSIQMLGVSQPLMWSQEETGLTVETPSVRPCDHAYTFKISLKAT